MIDLDLNFTIGISVQTKIFFLWTTNIELQISLPKHSQKHWFYRYCRTIYRPKKLLKDFIKSPNNWNFFNMPPTSFLWELTILSILCLTDSSSTLLLTCWGMYCNIDLSHGWVHFISKQQRTWLYSIVHSHEEKNQHANVFLEYYTLLYTISYFGSGKVRDLNLDFTLQILRYILSNVPRSAFVTEVCASMPIIRKKTYQYKMKPMKSRFDLIFLKWLTLAMKGTLSVLVLIWVYSGMNQDCHIMETIHV